nr:zinc finger AN1 domain-containing stress-associated protein 17-like [Setaria viridis]
MARRGTEFFPDLGAHCDEAECNQLDFLPFECDRCGGSFCAAHRTYRDHGCAKAADPGRTVVVCPDCGDSIERAAPGQADREILDAHARSRRCDPARRRRPPPQCPAPRCREALTFTNTTQCKGCCLKVCLKHRFPADHDCDGAAAGGCNAAFHGAIRGVRRLYRVLEAKQSDEILQGKQGGGIAGGRGALWFLEAW